MFRSPGYWLPIPEIDWEDGKGFVELTAYYWINSTTTPQWIKDLDEETECERRLAAIGNEFIEGMEAT